MAVSTTKFRFFRRNNKKQISFLNDISIENTEQEVSTKEIMRLLSNQKNPKRFSTHYIEHLSNRIR